MPSRGIEERPGLRLAAVAGVAIVVAGEHFIDRKFRGQLCMHRLNYLARLHAARDVGLIRNDDQPKARLAEPQQRVRHAGEHFQGIDSLRRIRLPVTHDDTVDHTIPVEKYSARHHLVDSHFVSATFSFGCDTSKCHTTA